MQRINYQFEKEAIKLIDRVAEEPSFAESNLLSTHLVVLKSEIFQQTISNTKLKK